MEATASKEIVEAIKSIPNEEKRAYLMALARSPHLLHRESCAERFLQCCGRKHSDMAARRFVDYWQKRRQIYNDDAAFLRLALSEPDVLSDSCKSLMQSGWISPLPPDKSGRRVCLLNLSVEKAAFSLFCSACRKTPPLARAESPSSWSTTTSQTCLPRLLSRR